MGAYNGAELFELVGTYIVNNLFIIINKMDIRIYSSLRLRNYLEKIVKNLFKKTRIHNSYKNQFKK